MSSTEGNAQDRTLLLVDNDERMVKQLKEVMEYQGFHVMTSLSGLVALEQLKTGRYSCVVLDYALPDINGYELAEKIRRDKPGIGLVLLTGFKPSIDSVKLEVFDYVFEKPVNLERLIAALLHIDSVHRAIDMRKNAHEIGARTG